MELITTLQHLYSSSTLIQHNNSPESLAISRPLPPPPTPCISSYHLLFAMLSHAFRVTAVGEQAEMGEKWRADQVYENMIYLLVFCNPGLNCTKTKHTLTTHTRVHAHT